MIAQPLVGNRLALAGAIIYLLEWVAILAFGAGTVPADPGTSAQTMVSDYKQHALAISLQAGWFSLVLMGRILFIAGIRDSLLRSGFRSILADFAVIAMALSVVLEIATYAVTGAAAYAAVKGADPSTIQGLDAAANLLNLSIWAPLGASILTAAWAMLLSRLFWSWLCWLGMAAGLVGCIGGVLNGAALQQGGALNSVLGPATAVAVIGFWLWMLITGVFLFRAAGRPEAVSTP